MKKREMVQSPEDLFIDSGLSTVTNGLGRWELRDLEV
jgi:hypothetical protein